MSPGSAAAMLQLEGVDTHRGPAQILRSLSLKVADGESVALVGRNGAGKTTTIESIMGLLPVRSGIITFRSTNITRLPTHVRARLGIGYAPEDAGIFPDLTVEENFDIGQWLAQPTGDRRAMGSGDDAQAKIFELFPEVRSFMQRRGQHLSGGQKKMVAIARALTLSPSILLLDEPFEGLAPVVVTRIIDAVKKVKAMGVSLLIAESNLANAMRVADRVYAIDRGEIIFQGEPTAVLENEEVMKTVRG
jgi:branched-chain amino acid transport system ATP-binding protein